MTSCRKHNVPMVCVFLPAGILFSNDKVLQSRLFSYGDAQRWVTLSFLLSFWSAVCHVTQRQQLLVLF